MSQRRFAVRALAVGVGLLTAVVSAKAGGQLGEVSIRVGLD